MEKFLACTFITVCTIINFWKFSCLHIYSICTIIWEARVLWVKGALKYSSGYYKSTFREEKQPYVKRTNPAICVIFLTLMTWNKKIMKFVHNQHQKITMTWKNGQNLTSPIPGLWFGLADLFRLFYNFLDSLAPEKTSGMQKCHIWAL